LNICVYKDALKSLLLKPSRGRHYNAFGMEMPNRKYTGSSSYRYTYNGKEKDSETGLQDYGARIYDNRIGKFLSTDPLDLEFPWYTPYQFAGNSPIEATDLDGAEEFHTQKGDVSPYTRMEYKGGAIDKVNAFLYNSTIAQIYNAASFAINKATKAVTKPKALAVDAGKGMVNLAKNIKAGLTTAPTWKGVKEAFSNPENYEAVPLVLIGVGVGKPKITVTSATAGGGFRSGATKLVSSEMLSASESGLTYGPAAGTFVAPTAEIDVLLSQGLTRAQIADRLGITDPKFLKGDLIRIDISADQLKNLNLRATTGAEAGANTEFVPGGTTSGGVTEGVVDGIPKGGAGVSTKKVELE